MPLKFRYVNSDFREVAAAFWLPQRAKRFNMARPKYEPEHVNTPHFVVPCDVAEIRVSDPPDDLFVMHFSPGAIIVDMAAVEGAVVTYTAGATPEATQRALDRAVGRRPGPDEPLQRRGNTWIILIGLHAVALVVLAAWIDYRRRQASE